MNPEQKLIEEIAQIDAATKAVNDFIKENFGTGELSPENERAREEAIQLLRVNYVGPEILGRLLYNDENKFPAVELDFVRLKEILDEPDEWKEGKKKFETYALVYVPPISFLELKEKSNEAASARGKTPALFAEDWYNTERFATEAPKAGSWELVRRATVPDSTAKVLGDQKALIADKPNLTPTSLPALAALLVGQYLEHDIRLYEGSWHLGRTSTCAAFGGPVNLGRMHAHGASLHGHGGANFSVGLSVSRNLK